MPGGTELTIKCDDLVFLDIESSGLYEDSYPIEVGYAGKDLNGSFLLNPDTATDDWSSWDDFAEEIHGITRNMLLKSGISVVDACNRLNTALEGKTVITDGYEYDTLWINYLFGQTLIKRYFEIRSIEWALEEFGSDLSCRFDDELLKIGDAEHRALSDSTRLYTAWKSVT
jgi:hypothetical protein